MLVVYCFKPFVFGVLARTFDCQMREPAVCLCAVPMLNPCRNCDNIAGLKTLRFLAVLLIPAFSVGAEKQLSAAARCLMNVPVVSAAGFKCYICG